MNKTSITDIKGVYASGSHCGIKTQGRDLAYVYVPQACACAGVFTRNAFRAPCIDFSKSCLTQETVKAVIVNSGNANAANGKQGLENTERTAELAASLLSLSPKEVAVASTGIIGVPLPMEPLESGLRQLLAQPEKQEGSLAADAILTTDTRTKEVFVECSVGAERIQAAGMAKGSGMIAPNMGTMLAFLVTNARVSQSELQVILQEAVDESFNMLSIDTDTSTSDMVLLFSTGEHEISFDDRTEQHEFLSLITEACTDLAKMVAADGEGAEKLIEVQVQGAATKQDAKTIARNIVESPLVKTAIHGADPNWGRVIMAIGKDPGVKVEPNLVDLSFGDTQVLSKGEKVDYKTTQISEAFAAKEVVIFVNLNLGTAEATAWGCDLTKGYIDINVDYN